MRTLGAQAGRRAAILIMHRAPYRDPVLDRLARQCLVDVFAIYPNDKGHLWAGFKNDVPVLAGRGLVFRLLRKFVFSRRYLTVFWPAYHPWWLTLPITLSAFLSKRYVLTSDTKEENGGRFSRMIKQYVFRRAIFIWTPGEAACRFLVANYGVPPEHLLRGLYVVDRKNVAEIPKVPSASCKRFLMVANDTPNRRIDVMVEGFRRWRKGDEQLTLCGCGCSRYAGAGVVGLEGVLWTELPQLYDVADVYVHNGMEQFSTAVQIAAMRGMPIVCSGAVGIVSDFNKPEDTMVVVRDWKSASAWENAFEQLAMMNSTDLQGMCEQVRKDAVSLYDVDRVANEVVKGLKFL